jgi:hypothetical protein
MGTAAVPGTVVGVLDDPGGPVAWASLKEGLEWSALGLPFLERTWLERGCKSERPLLWPGLQNHLDTPLRILLVPWEQLWANYCRLLDHLVLPRPIAHTTSDSNLE